MLRLNVTYAHLHEFIWLVERLEEQNIAQRSRKYDTGNGRYRVYIDLKEPLPNKRNTEKTLENTEDMTL